MADFILLDEDFSDFPIGEFPYDKNHSAMGEYHFIHYPGYYGKWYDPVCNHTYNGQGASWIISEYNGKHYIHFLLANNIITDAKAQKINNYLPCVAWGQTAKQIASYKVNDAVKIKGSLHSRQYKKQLSEEEFEYRVAHELLVTDCELLDGANI